jgi:replicative DNA helicase
MRIIDGQPEIAKIKDHIMLHKKITRNTPVVFIDYLQIVKSKEGSSSDRRLQIDEIVSELRILSVQYQTPIFVISSLNRAAYKNDKTKTTGQSNEDEKTIYMADLKESGGIEYGADAILTLYADKEDEEKNGARDMKLRIIKNRTGKRHRKNEHIKLKFHAMFNYFEDCGKSDGETATEDQKETNKKNKKKGKENQKGYIMP